jgi:hypothetical protein
MVRITVTRVPYGYTFLINGRGDVVFDPGWGLATFATPEAARRTAEEVVRSLATPGGPPGQADDA